MCAECHLAKQFSRGDRTRNAAESEILLAFKHHNENIGDSMDAPQYPGYHSQHWYPQAHSTGHYTSTYPSGSDVQPQYAPQVAPGAYPNAAYSHYPASAFQPSHPFYGADPQRASSGPFPTQGCPAEQSSGPPPQQQHHYAPPHCHGGPGFASGAYLSPPNPPYPPSSQADTWTRPGGYAPSQQPWQPGQSQYVRPAHPPAWPGTGSGAPPPYQPKDQKQQGGPPAGGRARPGPPSKASAEISSPPHMYPRSRRPGGDAPAAPSPPSPAPGPGPGPGQAAPQALSLARVQEVVSRVLLLQEDVDEFVGKKTDKSYRCLEELLTKELLVLDSVETGGQETVRQARREVVQRIQAILDQLEKKAF